MKIKIYSKTYEPLTTLVQSGRDSDYNDLEYRDILHQIGDCKFTVRLDNVKTTEENLRHYNIVEVTEDDDSIRWVGVIVHRQVRFNTATITCFSMMYLLSRRITAGDISYNDTAGNVASSLLAATNGDLDTEISAGTMNDPTDVQVTFNHASVYEALKRVAEASGGQFIINGDRTLDFKQLVGTDLSSSVVIQYRVTLIASANVLNFQVEDDGKKIITNTFGESSGLTSEQEDATLAAKYGLLEKYNNFREIDDQTTLDNATTENNEDSQLSPLLKLSPKVEDNFEVGDTIKVILENRLVEINDAYQITEKRVKIKGGEQREISLRVISNTSDFFSQMREISNTVELLNREV